MTSDRATEADAQRSADRLALALEDAGFDVGQDVPGAARRDRLERLGRRPARRPSSPTTADRLAGVLSRAAARGITINEEDADT